MKAMFLLYEGIPRVLYRATRRIEENEELLIDYSNTKNSSTDIISNMNKLVQENFFLHDLFHSLHPADVEDPSKPVYLRGRPLLSSLYKETLTFPSFRLPYHC